MSYERVNHPKHYNAHPSGVECVTISEHFPHCLASALEYIWRAGLKPGTDVDEDLRKAIWWLERHRALVQRAGGRGVWATMPTDAQPSLSDSACVHDCGQMGTHRDCQVHR